ncbi:MAG: hypothetical protein D6748_05015 [Calditrichaeota bacterium]|nr:MAG: hypothetical protein D6748_05015 [Calditrichota bacterium]
MRFSRFLKLSSIVVILFIAGAEGIMHAFGLTSSRNIVYLGLIIAYGNAIIGFAAISWGYRRTHQQFMIALFGSMIFRFLLIFSLLFILIGAFKIDAIPLASGLLVAYFLFLALEIFQVYRNTEITRK